MLREGTGVDERRLRGKMEEKRRGGERFETRGDCQNGSAKTLDSGNRS